MNVANRSRARGDDENVAWFRAWINHRWRRIGPTPGLQSVVGRAVSNRRRLHKMAANGFIKGAFGVALLVVVDLTNGDGVNTHTHTHVLAEIATFLRRRICQAADATVM